VIGDAVAIITNDVVHQAKSITGQETIHKKSQNSKETRKEAGKRREKAESNGENSEKSILGR